MFSNEAVDPEYPTMKGDRLDKTDLTAVWLRGKKVNSVCQSVSQSTKSVMTTIGRNDNGDILEGLS